MEERDRNPEAPPGSGKCADPQDNLRLWDFCSILPGPQSEHGATGLGGEEPVHLLGDGIPGGLDGAVSGPQREFVATLDGRVNPSGAVARVAICGSKSTSEVRARGNGLSTDPGTRERGNGMPLWVDG